jgi:4-carboxymuconolactone decarboxylase
MKLHTFLVSGLFAGLLGVPIASAQVPMFPDRFPQLPADKMTDVQKKVVADIVAGPRGSFVGPFVPLLRSPDLEARLQKVGEYLRYNAAIGRRNTEFVILITARNWSQQFEWGQHAVIAQKEGIQPAKISAIADGRRPADMTDEEEMLYNFADELLRNKSVSEPTFARVKAKFGEQGVIDMTGLMGYYTTLAMIMNVAQTPGEAGAPRLPALPN